MKIVISHPTGNQNSREAAKAFEETGKLKSFITALHIPSEKAPWTWLPNTIRTELRRRDFLDVTPNIASGASFRELTRLICSKLKVNLGFILNHESGFASVDKIYHAVDKYVAKRIEQNDTIEAVYAYEDGALKTFEVAKRKGIKCIYELPIGYWRENMRLNQEESLKEPAWSNTWNSMKDSELKLQRKDKELELADVIIVASSFTKQTLEACPVPLAPIKVIPYGFPTPIAPEDREWYDATSPLKLLYVGGLSQRKGLSYLVEAVKKLGTCVTVSVIGTGEGLGLLQAALPGMNYLGSMPHDQVLANMRMHDVLLFPSLFEGFGMVITEAMSQGMVVVATERTALPDVADEQSGICVPAGNSDAIVEAVESLLADKNKVKSMGMAAIEKAKNYQWSDYRAKVSGLI